MYRVNLKGNPITSIAGYDDTVTAMLPQIDVLDTKRIRSKHARRDSTVDVSKRPCLVGAGTTKKDPEETMPKHIGDDDDDDAIEAEDFVVVSSKKNKSQTKTSGDLKKHQSKPRKKTHGSKDALHTVLHVKETTLPSWD